MAINRSIIFFSCLLLSFKSFALSISIEKETNDGIMQKAITTDGPQNYLIKNSNLFDKDSQAIGKYQITNLKNLNESILELERLSKALDLISKNVVNSSSLVKPIHEKEYLKINKHYITTSHPLFKEIDKNISHIFENIKTAKIDTMEIIKENGFFIKIITANKKQEKQNLIIKESCQQIPQGLMCTDEKYGSIIIK